MGFFKPNVEKMEKNKDVDGLIKALKHKDVDVRRRAAESFGKIGDARAVEPLIQALKDEFVRSAATESLGKMGTPAVEPLIQALTHEDYNVRLRLAESLGKIGDARAVEPLIQALKDEEIYNIPGSAIVQSKVTEALKKMKVTEFSR